MYNGIVVIESVIIRNHSIATGLKSPTIVELALFGATKLSAICLNSSFITRGGKYQLWVLISLTVARIKPSEEKGTCNCGKLKQSITILFFRSIDHFLRFSSLYGSVCSIKSACFSKTYCVNTTCLQAV